MAARREVVVVGGGAMGSATAWQLARRGREVTLLERFGARHHQGASHGRSRNFNTSYVDATYQAMLHESDRLWHELQDDSGRHLFDRTGLVDHGAGVAPDLAEALVAVGQPATSLSPDEAAERWSGIRFDTRVVHLPGSGRVDAEEAVVALQEQAAHHGAEVLLETAVEAVTPRTDGTVEVVTPGATYLADVVVVTVGAWTERLLGGTVPLPRLRVTQEQPAHFAVTDHAARWPGFNHVPLAGDERYGYWFSPVYGMLTPGEGVKAGWHGTGPVTDPDHRTFRPERRQLEALRRYARDWLPGADPDAVSPISCTYTTTADEHFVLDRLGSVVVGAGFSGHGFKFVPAVGRLLADLATGAGPAPAVFSARRATGPVGAPAGSAGPLFGGR